LAFPREAFSWHPGTCRWLFKTPEFTRWRKHDDSTVLWLHGLPGAGKTTLASFALEHIRATLAPNEALGVYFWQRGTTIDVAKSILKSITRQLLKLDSDGYDKASLHRVMATIDANSPPMSTWTFRRHLKTLLHSVPTTANLFLIFDGLDEYVNIADHILSEVGLLRSNANRSGHIKCIMTGRNKCSTQVSTIDALEIDLDGNRFVEQDMSLVVRDKCIELSRQFPSRQKALESLGSRILENIQGVFLRILLMLHDLSRRLRSEDFDVSRIIECLPLQIESIYQQRLQLIEESDRVLSSRVFILLTCAVRPLRFDELSEALSLVLPGYSRPESVLSESFLLHRCGGLVVIYKDHTVDFLHHSIREHLIAKRNKALPGDDFLRDCQTHTLLAQACLQCLLQREQAREATPVADHAPSSRGSATPGQAFESYAARFWSLHYRLAESQDSYLAGLLQDVLDTSIGTRLNRISECSMPNLVNPLSSTPRNTIFRECVKIGSTTLAQIYLEMGIDVNTKLYPSGASALHCAAASGQANVVKLLLKKGASINSKTILHGRTALHFACDRGDANVVETLLRHSADLNVKTINNTETPLHVAAARGHLEVMKLLLQSGANVNATTSITAETPLHIAAAYGFVDEANYLLEGRWQSWSGAATPSSPGTPPSDLAPDHKPSSSNTWSFDSTLSYDAPSMDIDILYTSKSYQPVDIGAKNCDGWTPLHVAAASGNLDIVRLLLHHGAEINTKTFDGRTAPYLAADYGHQFVSSVLVALNFNQSSKSQLACRSNRLVVWRGHCEFEGLHREENDDSDAEMELNFEQSHQSESGILDGQDDWTIIMVKPNGCT
jgi:ankyrin repeat protein